MDVIAVWSLLTALATSGCTSSAPEPEVNSPPPAAVARVQTLRVGLPSPRRGNLLFACDAPASAPKLGSAAYAPDSLDASGRRWRRIEQEFADSAGALAPDTLIVHGFDDATDEEIALERGELDVAVFWPGELSVRMRADARFRDAERGLRSRGVLAAVAAAADTSGAPPADLEALNREAFGGDLMPWGELEPPANAAADPPPARYAVDPTVPGAKHLERLLARVARPASTRTLKLVYLDQPLVTGATGRPAWRTPGVTPLFAMRCPVLAGAPAVEAVHAIGAGAFAELAPCAGGTRP